MEKYIKLIKKRSSSEHYYRIKKHLEPTKTLKKYYSKNNIIGENAKTNIKKKYFKNLEIKKLLVSEKVDEGQKKGEVREYRKGKELGKGAFGVCYVFDRLDNWEQNVVKIVDKTKLTKDKSQQSIISEIKIQQTLDNPKIVKVKGYAEDTENVYIILELCKNGTLSQLVKNRGHLTEIEVKSYMFQLIQGLKYIHSKNIIHRDLKPSNLFLDEKLELKIGDYGLIAKLNKENERKHTRCGTLYYMAPEIIKRGEKGYSFEVDIWSIGVIMFNLLTGEYPFYDNKNGDPIEIERKIVEDNFEFPNNIKLSNAAKDLIRQLLEKDPKKRPTLNQIVYHDFFHTGRKKEDKQFPTFPKYPDISTLKKGPNIDEIRKYMPEADKDSIVDEEVVYTNLYKLIVNDTDIKYNDINKYVIKKSKVNLNHERIIFCHESHYGFFYYELNNGLYGAIYRSEETYLYDGLNLLINEQGNKFYEITVNEYKDECKAYKMDDCPEKLKSKLDQLINYHKTVKEKKERKKEEKDIYENNFKSDENIGNEINTISTGNGTNESESSQDNKDLIKNNKIDENNLLYLRSITMEKYAKFCTLSNNSKQIIFKDKIQIILLENNEYMLFIDKSKKINEIALIGAIKNSNRELTSRLRYIRHVNYKAVKDKLQRKLEDQKDDENKNNKEEKLIQ